MQTPQSRQKHQKTGGNAVRERTEADYNKKLKHTLPTTLIPPRLQRVLERLDPVKCKCLNEWCCKNKLQPKLVMHRLASSHP